MPLALIIDDEDMARHTMRRILERGGYEVACAANGTEGLRAFGQLQPDVVVTDIMMPERDGIETIMSIRAQDRQVRIVAISGGARFGTLDFLRMARTLGADVVLAKPFGPDELLDAVGRQPPGRPVD